MATLLLGIIYLSFISLGLPDALLGAAWPIMYPEFQVPVSYAGLISAIISVGTIISSLFSDRLTHRLGPGKVTALSVATTALALFGFSVSHSFLQLCLWAVPYGLGAGSVDAALNNYVAVHYSSRHMSWLHCMWGLGASTGPYVMGYILTGGHPWPLGYRCIGTLQIVLTALLFLSLPLWKTCVGKSDSSVSGAPLTLPEIVRIAGAKEVMLAFFCYCGLEQTAGLWASSYLVLQHGLSSEMAAGYASLFYVGLTAGRGLCGFLTLKWNDTQMIFIGQAVSAAGIAILLLPLGPSAALAGLILTGVGCAPIYPSIIHSTPTHFGASRSQALIGIQMACAYVGTCLMPPVFGFLANHISIALYPVFLLAVLFLMTAMHLRLLQKISH